MDVLLIVLIVLLAVAVLTGGEARSRNLGVPWGLILGVIILALLLRATGFL